MDYFLKDYNLKSDFDPRIVNNASLDKKPIKDIGFIYNCVYKQKKAFLFSLDSICKIYPKSKIYVVSDGGEDFSFIENEQIKFKMEEDTVSSLKNINQFNYLESQNQINMKRGIKATIRRISEGLEYCGYPEWFCMTEPDVFIRGKMSYPANAKLLGSRVNYAWYKKDWIKSFIEINKLLEKVEGAIPIVRWGAAPIIGKTETLLKGIKIYKDNFKTLDALTEKFNAVGGFDLILPIIFALAGEQEIFNDEYTECLRNPDWEESSAVVIHQFRKYYENNDFYWGIKSKDRNYFTRVNLLKRLINKIIKF